MNAGRILLVEDDDEIRELVGDLLRGEGYAVDEAGDARAMDRCLQFARPDVVVLDVNLPGEDGWSICRRLAARGEVAIIMLTARGADLDRIIGLELGADDYLGKPFNPRELIARVRAVLRRTRPSEGRRAVLKTAGLEIDPRTRQVRRDDGVPLALSGAEYELLLAFAETPGEILSRESLLARVHGRPGNPLDRSIDVLVSRLRRKIDGDGPSRIVNVRNSGYVLREAP
jgi:two-component system, OmpR family, response regulator